MYVVSYFVKKGAGKGKRNAKRSQPVANGKSAGAAAPPDNGVLASCVARYVFKEGRATVRPAIVLEECGLIPPEQSETGKEEGSSVSWSRAQFEQERLKGLEVAAKFTGLEVLPTMFDASQAPVLGNYIDF